MTPPPDSPFESIPPKRSRLLIAGVLGAGMLVLLGGASLGWTALNNAVVRASARPPSDARVGIDLFTPETPAIQAGDVMDVGPLVDGYQHRAARPPAAEWGEPEVWTDDALPLPPAPRREARVEVYPVEADRPPQWAERRAPNRPAFGFDAPRPDYAQARRERRERLDDAQRRPPWRPDRRGDDWRSRPVEPTREVPITELDRDGYAG